MCRLSLSQSLAPLTLSRTLMAEAMPTMPTPTTVTLFLQPTGSSFMTWLISFSLVDICAKRNQWRRVRAETKGPGGVDEVGGGEMAGGMSHLNWKSMLGEGGAGGGDVEGSGREERRGEPTGPHTEACKPPPPSPPIPPCLSSCNDSTLGFPFQATNRIESLPPLTRYRQSVFF